jgi:hypothetical protein
MKQYRYTTANYTPQETAIPDAVMDTSELNDIRRLAGMPLLAEHGEKIAPTKDPENNISPVGSDTHADFSHTDFAKGEGANISKTAMEKRKIEHDKNIRPGTDEWFQLWFSKPYLTGEKPTRD